MATQEITPVSTVFQLPANPQDSASGDGSAFQSLLTGGTDNSATAAPYTPPQSTYTAQQPSYVPPQADKPLPSKPASVDHSQKLNDQQQTSSAQSAQKPATDSGNSGAASQSDSSTTAAAAGKSDTTATKDKPQDKGKTDKTKTSDDSTAAVAAAQSAVPTQVISADTAVAALVIAAAPAKPADDAAAAADAAALSAAAKTAAPKEAAPATPVAPAAAKSDAPVLPAAALQAQAAAKSAETALPAAATLPAPALAPASGEAPATPTLAQAAIDAQQTAQSAAAPAEEFLAAVNLATNQTPTATAAQQAATSAAATRSTVTTKSTNGSATATAADGSTPVKAAPSQLITPDTVVAVDAIAQFGSDAGGEKSLGDLISNGNAASADHHAASALANNSSTGQLSFGSALTEATGTQPAAAPQAPAPATPRLIPVAEQVSVGLFKAATAGNSSITIQMHPDNLGRVGVNLNIGHDGTVVASISADRSDTLMMLQRDSQSLQQALQDAGLKADVGSFNFSLSGDAKGGQPGSNANGAPSGSVLAAQEIDDPTADGRQSAGLGLVNIRV